MINYVFPGTFDPITYGHFAVINKFSNFIKKDDKIIIAISSSPMKKPFLSFNERFEIVESILLKKNNQSESAKISTEKIIGNTAEFIHQKKAICIRGIRNIDDLKYESYWPVSRSSKHPVDIFLLIPILDQNSKSISSTFFKNQFNELVSQNNNYNHCHEQLKYIAHEETIDIFYKKHFLNNKENYHNDILSSQGTPVGSTLNNSNINNISKGGSPDWAAGVIEEDDNISRNLSSSDALFDNHSGDPLCEMNNLKDDNILAKNSIKNGSVIGDFNVLDNGHINFIHNSLNLTDKLTIFIPEIIEHQKIPFEKRFNSIKQLINELEIPVNDIIKCKELKNPKEIADLLKSHNINQLFFEMREYHTRNEQRLANVFDQMQELSKDNIDLIVILQEKFRDISQPLIFNIGHDNYEAKVLDENSMLRKYIPELSHEIIKEFINDFYKK